MYVCLIPECDMTLCIIDNLFSQLFFLIRMNTDRHTDIWLHHFAYGDGKCCGLVSWNKTTH